LDQIWNEIIPAAETSSICAVMHIAPFVTLYMYYSFSVKKMYAYISKENSSYGGKRSTRFYVGQVTDVDVKCYEMTFLRKSDDNGKIFAFPSKENKYCIEEEQIVEKLEVLYLLLIKETSTTSVILS
jgi:hypothetical protein